MRHTPATLALAAALCMGGCSLTLDWDPEGLACNGADQECAGTFTCLDGKCIKPHARSAGQSCQADLQCPEGYLCPTGVCAAPCDMQTAYTVGSCGAGEYCGAFLSYAGSVDASTPLAPRWVAACVGADTCSPGATCTQVAQGLCTTLSTAPQVQACLPNCAVAITSGTVSTNCTSAFYPRYCTPVGVVNNQQLTCVNAGSAPLPAGERCNTAYSPCSTEAGCIQGVCRSYCQLGATASGSSGCGAAQQCCPLQVNATVLVGYCADACP